MSSREEQADRLFHFRANPEATPPGVLLNFWTLDAWLKAATTCSKLP